MDGAACVKKAYEFILRNDFESAIYWFEKAIELEPRVADYYYRCSISCARSGKWQKAMDYAKHALLLEPHNQEFHYQAEIVEARLLYITAQQAIEAKPPQWTIAIEQLERSFELDALNFEVPFTLSMVYDAAGDIEKALKYVREALKLSPDHAAARTLFANIKRKYRKISNKRNRQ